MMLDHLSSPLAAPTTSIAPYGEWQSPISAAQLAAGAQSLSYPYIAANACYWLEGRSTEGGRITLMRWQPGKAAAAQELTPRPANVRSRVHEYGGGSYLVLDDGFIYSDFADNQLYRVIGANAPHRITDGDPQFRYADFILDAKRERLIAVCEDHHTSSLNPINTLCSIALDGSGERMILAQGQDFYAAPRLSPNGLQLVWLCWNHPRMPWEGCELWRADIDEQGLLYKERKVAGSEREAICQPQWSPDGALYFVSDRSGWWNIYRCLAGVCICVLPRKAEFGAPHWQFGISMYGFISAHEMICTYIEEGISHLARINLTETPGVLHLLDTGYTDIQNLHVGPNCVLMVAGAPHLPAQMVLLDLGEVAKGRHGLSLLETSVKTLPPAAFLSRPEKICYAINNPTSPTSPSNPTRPPRTTHAFYYPPCNPAYQAPKGELPPLIVISHGGPTGMASNALRLAIQYWTSRGFALLDVNYGGSSGFGRTYRNLLKGQWGVVDVEDCINGARHLVQQNKVNGERLIIRGGSAGGFTTLCALMFHDVFKVGASYYGVSNLRALDQDSHKFESHYNHYLIAPPPENEALYQQRSPSNHTDKLRSPMIFFQGQDDKVVPPAQSEEMVQALRKRKIPVAYLTFEGEGHGFRKAENIQRTLEAELYFYRKVLGMNIDASETSIEIENLEKTAAKPSKATP